MKALSLKQPWASLVAIGAKKWETRSWKPSTAMHYLLQRDGMLIHSSAKFTYMDAGMMTFPPFHQYRNEPFPLGKILCWVRVGRIIPTSDWRKEFFHEAPSSSHYEEREFGNYESGRWAWETTDLIKFETPIAAKGSLSLWECNESLPEIIPQPPQ